MNGFLLDVNVLIALVRQDHVSHEAVKRWFQQTGATCWATCALTEASFVRVVSNPGFSEHSLDITEAMEMLGEVTELPGHVFWNSELSFLDATQPIMERLFGHQQVTDAYLLGMAIRNEGKLVTLDRGIEGLAGSEFKDNVVELE